MRPSCHRHGFANNNVVVNEKCNYDYFFLYFSLSLTHCIRFKRAELFSTHIFNTNEMHSEKRERKKQAREEEKNVGRN